MIYTKEMRYPVITQALMQKEIDRSARIQRPELIPGRRIDVLEALCDPRNQEKQCDESYYLDEEKRFLDHSTGHRWCNWIGLAGLAVAKRDISEEQAVQAVVFGCDVPWAHIPCTGVTQHRSFRSIADVLVNIFDRLDLLRSEAVRIK